MKSIKSFASLFVVLALCGLSAFGQTTMTSTTNSVAITASQLTVTLASVTGVVKDSILVIEQEALVVMATPASASVPVQVRRGTNGTRSVSHVITSVVWVGTPNQFADVAPKGQCVRTNLRVVPIIVLPSGEHYDCLGLTTAGRFARTDAPGTPIVGSTVASATSITPTGTFFVVSGTTAVATIVVPAGWNPGMCLEINPSGIFATTTAGNIAVITSATVVNRILRMCWNGTAWVPSYIS